VWNTFNNYTAYCTSLINLY